MSIFPKHKSKCIAQGATADERNQVSECHAEAGDTISEDFRLAHKSHAIRMQGEMGSKKSIKLSCFLAPISPVFFLVFFGLPSWKNEATHHTLVTTKLHGTERKQRATE